MLTGIRGIRTRRITDSPAFRRRRRLGLSTAGMERLESRIVLAGLTTPAIMGTVFGDRNGDGEANDDEVIEGVSLQLFRDNGDGVFDESTDLETGTTTTDTAGSYCFDALDAAAEYYVVQPAQFVDGVAFHDVISSLLVFDEADLISFDVSQPVTADVAVTKTNGVLSLVPGEEVVYTIVVSNAGPDDALRVSVSDAFPAVLTDVMYTSSSVGEVTGNTPRGDGDIDDLVTIGVDSALVYRVTGRVRPDATGSLSNTATVGAPDDPFEGNNTAVDTDPLVPTADLSISKTSQRDSVEPGDTVTYTIVATNSGPSDAPASRIFDDFPVGLTNISYLRDDGVEGVGDIDELVDLAVSASVTYQVTATVAPLVGSSIRNTAVVAAAANVIDPSLVNNSATNQIDTNVFRRVLGSEPTILLTDSLGDFGSSRFYELMAHSTGLLLVTTHFDTEFDDVSVAVIAQDGNTIVSGGANEQLSLPVISQATYVIAMAGADQEVPAEFDLEIENFPVSVPDVIQLTPDSDSGRFDDDANTAEARPTIVIQADLESFLSRGIPLLEPEDPDLDNQTLPGGPGVAVRVTVTNLATGDARTGYASAIADGGALYLSRPTRSAPLDSGIYVVSSAAEVFDGSADDDTVAPNSGRGPLSQPFWLTIDQDSPRAADQPVLLTSSDTGMSLEDGVTSKMQPTFAGSGEPNAIVRMIGNRPNAPVEVLAQSVVNADGQWQLAVEPLSDDSYLIRTEFEDLAGNTSAIGAPLVIDVDTRAPNTPFLDLLNDTGRSFSDNVTASDTLTFSMTTTDPPPGNQLSPFNLKYRLYVRADGSGTETLVYDSSLDDDLPAENRLDGLTDLEQLTRTLGPFADGVHNFKLEVEDRAGNVSDDFLLEVEIDTDPPVLNAFELAELSDSGMSSSDRVTNIRQPAFLGRNRVGDQVLIFANGQLVGQTTVGSDASDGDPDDGLGFWEVTVEPLDDGVYDVVAQVEDLAGNTRSRGPIRIEIDTLEPNTPRLDLLEAFDTGRRDDDNITSVASLTFAATSSDPNEQNHLDLFPDGQNFKYRVFVRPESGAESLAYDSSTDPDLDDLLDGLTARTAVLAAIADFPEGLHNLKLEVEDRAGNISHDFLIDVLVDLTAFAGDGRLHPESDTGVISLPDTFEDGITQDRQPLFTGRAEADALVTVSIDGAPAGTAVAVPLDGDDAVQPPSVLYDLDGNWQLASAIALQDGAHVAEFVYEDVAGNRESSTLVFVVDTEGPRVENVTLDQAGFRSVFDPKPASGPDPLIDRIVIHLSDGLAATEEVPLTLLREEGNYRLVGDANGNIPLVDVDIDFDDFDDGPFLTRATLIFNEPLPDDRFTLTVSDSIRDVAGNRLDGESGAAAPFEGAPGSSSVSPIFPSGDRVPGGDFVARFNVDSRPEIGTWAAGSVYVDTNGNFRFDPDNIDPANRDIVYTAGFASDDVFAGNFALFADDVTDGFDKLAVYGRFDGAFRFLIDTDNDGVPNIDRTDPHEANGLPVAGRFDDRELNGDEVGVFDGRAWYLDTDHDFRTDLVVSSSLAGYPIVGDFDGDGFDDLATWSDNRFSIDFADGSLRGWDGFADRSITFGFTGVRERPVAADMDQDGFDDLGLWVPDRDGVPDRAEGEWYFLISGGESLLDRISPPDDPVDSRPTIDFTPRPFGADLFAQFGDEFALPVVGNFDPPTVLLNVEPDEFTNPQNPLDVNDDGDVSPLDALLIINVLNASGPRRLTRDLASSVYLDVNRDEYVTPIDALLILNEMNRSTAASALPLRPEDRRASSDRAAAILADQAFAWPARHQSLDDDESVPSPAVPRPTPLLDLPANLDHDQLDRDLDDFALDVARPGTWHASPLAEDGPDRHNPL